MYTSRGRRSRRVNPLARGLLLLVIGVIFGAVGIFLTVQTLAFLPGSVSAQGQIVRCNMVADSDGSDTCQPVVRFVVPSGQAITFTSTDSSSNYEQGKIVTVIYHPDDPGDARLDSALTIWLFPLLFGGVGLLLCILGLLTLVRAFFRRVF